jgi:hypothetical protein
MVIDCLLFGARLFRVVGVVAGNAHCITSSGSKADGLTHHPNLRVTTTILFTS